MKPERLKNPRTCLCSIVFERRTLLLKRPPTIVSGKVSVISGIDNLCIALREKRNPILWLATMQRRYECDIVTLTYTIVQCILKFPVNIIH